MAMRVAITTVGSYSTEMLGQSLMEIITLPLACAVPKMHAARRESHAIRCRMTSMRFSTTECTQSPQAIHIPFMQCDRE